LYTGLRIKPGQCISHNLEIIHRVTLVPGNPTTIW
jgi:hypothetical protein